jgi:transposase
MSTTSFLGIDIAKASFEVALQVGQQSYTGRFANDAAGFVALSRWLARWQSGPVWATLEATGRYGEALAGYLHRHGHTVSVVNPARIKAYGASKLRRAKNDRLDAALILDFGRTQLPRTWTPPRPEVQELREQVRRVADLQQQQQQERNRLQAGGQSELVLADIRANLAGLTERLKQWTRRLESHIRAYPSLERPYRLLRSIPGIGLLTAARLLAEVTTDRPFTDPRQLVAYAGLAPAVHHSGSSVHRRPQLSKQGNAVLRAQLYMPALVALRHNPVIQAMQQRMLLAGKPKMVIVIAAMRKLLHLVYGVLKSGRPFDPAIPLPSTSCP